MTERPDWTYEVHELSEGFSGIVYDEYGSMVADHLSEGRARLIAAAPDMLATLRTASWLLADISPAGLVKKQIDEVIAKALGGGA